MREILFRGKQIDNGEWVEGFYLKYADGGCTISVPQPDNSMLQYIIEPSTAGQFTGLADKNGTKIFEGDIVEYEGKRYRIDYLTHYARFSAVKPNTVFCVFAYQRGEVIGNIHDNPELIGGAENE